MITLNVHLCLLFARFKNVQCIVVPKHLSYDFAWECQKCLVQYWKTPIQSRCDLKRQPLPFDDVDEGMFISTSVIYVSRNCMWDCLFSLSKVKTRCGCLDSTSSVHLENSCTKKLTNTKDEINKQSQYIS